MASSSSSSSFRPIIVIVTLTFLVFFMGASHAQLSKNFYAKTCPQALAAVKYVVRAAVAKELRMGASLLRMHFHDCFVNGCDASVLLDDTPTFIGEKTALPNNNSLRGFEVVDAIKAKVEKLCPGVVSCADILTIAARDSVELLGGPSWTVKLGRRDAKTTSLAAANSGVIPPPTATLDQLITRFRAQGLSPRDLVALSGAHTIGKIRCLLFRDRIYNETNIDPLFAKLRQKTCPRTVGVGDDNLAPFDFKTPTTFDNQYYKNLLNQQGLLHSDQILFNGDSADSLVKKYSNNPNIFISDFVKAMIRMGDNKLLTGSNGEIRKNCRRPN